MEARRALTEGPAGPEEVRQPGIVQARDDSRHELAAQVLRPRIVEQHRRRRVIESEELAVELHEARRVGRPGPDLDWLGSTRGLVRESGEPYARLPRAPDGLEQAEIEPEIDDPAAIEPAEALGELVEAVGGVHR